MVAAGLIYLPSGVADFEQPELRPYLDKYVRGSNGIDAIDRVKLLKLLWDAIGSEFASRHELYEINYAGSYEQGQLDAYKYAVGAGLMEQLKARSISACPTTTSTAGRHPIWSIRTT